MQKEKNNYAFIDSQNLNLGVRALGWHLDFGRFRVYLQEKYNVLKAFLFIGYVPGNERLYTSLQNQGYLVVFKPTLILPNGVVKGNVDAELLQLQQLGLPSSFRSRASWWTPLITFHQYAQGQKLLAPSSSRNRR